MNNPENSEKDNARSRLGTPTETLNPGDEAARGTPGTGEDICPQCHGSGRIDGSPCQTCGGSGKIVKAIGGA